MVLSYIEILITKFFPFKWNIFCLAQFFFFHFCLLMTYTSYAYLVSPVCQRIKCYAYLC